MEISNKKDYNQYITAKNGTSSSWEESQEERDRDEAIVKDATEGDNGYVSRIKKPEQGKEGLSSVAGMADIKKAVHDCLIFPLKHRDLYKKFNRKMPNGIVMFGPPGCGKTYLATKIAEECKMNYAILSPAAVNNQYWEGPQKLIEAIFADARLHAPCLLFFDEFDNLFPNRTNAPSHKSDAVSQILTDVNECGNHGVFVIFATNLPSNVDPAIFRSGRISKRIYVGPPDRDTRIQVMKMNLDGVPVSNDINFELLADKTEGRIISDIVAIVDHAKDMAIMGNGVKISQKMLEKAISEIEPSINESQMLTYKQEAEKYLGIKKEESKKIDMPVIRKIGFKHYNS